MFSKNIGPCALIYDSVDIGLSKGGVNLTIDRLTAETVADKTGSTGREEIVTGHVCNVTGAITEATLAQLAKLLGTTVTAGATTDELMISNQVGKDLVSEAKTLILKPIVEGVVSVTDADWITIPKAVVNAKFETPFELDNQKVWGFEFKGKPLTADDVASGATWGTGGWSEGDICKLGDAD